MICEDCRLAADNNHQISMFDTPYFHCDNRCTCQCVTDRLWEDKFTVERPNDSEDML